MNGQANIFESYHNSGKETGKLLAIYSDIAKKQDIAVLRFFQANVGRSFTAAEVYEKLKKKGEPLTSYRRAITNLTDEGYLTDTRAKRMGHLGRKTTTWTLTVKN